MSAEIIPFEFESSASAIRVVEIDGEPWFVAKDVMVALEYTEATITNIADKISHVPEDWKGRHPMATLRGMQDLWCLSEPGLYFFVGRSDKPKALPFQMWVAGEVLPSLRQRGYYGELKPGEVLRYHTALSRTIRQLETTQNALSQNDESIRLQQCTGDHRILRAEAQELGYLVVPIENPPPCDVELLTLYAQWQRDSGQIHGAIAAAFEDEVITPDEQAEIQRRFFAAASSGLTYIHRMGGLLQ